MIRSSLLIGVESQAQSLMVIGNVGTFKNFLIVLYDKQHNYNVLKHLTGKIYEIQN